MTTPGVQIWPATPIDHIDRTNNTLARVQHPKDHDDLEHAVNAILLILGSQPYGASDNLTAELTRLLALIAESKAAALAAADAAQVALMEIADLQLGGSRSLSHYVHYQRSTADTWLVQHDLDYDPVVEVVGEDGTRILGFDLSYAADHKSVTLGFSQAITGRALLSN